MKIEEKSYCAFDCAAKQPTVITSHKNKDERDILWLLSTIQGVAGLVFRPHKVLHRAMQLIN